MPNGFQSPLIGYPSPFGGSGQRAYDQAALDILYQFPALLTGAWDDTEPTSPEWQAYVGNVVFGVWDDNEPTGTPTASDEPAYTLWDDSEATT